MLVHVLHGKVPRSFLFDGTVKGAAPRRAHAICKFFEARVRRGREGTGSGGVT